LEIQNHALLLKFLHKFYQKQVIPWVQLVWEKHYQDHVPHAQPHGHLESYHSLSAEGGGIQFYSGMISGLKTSYL
jgi:hypothetical protein